MSFLQFLRIFWTRRFLILATTGSCLIGALAVVLVLPPRWEAHSRVMLNQFKPDPVTGEVINGSEFRSYAGTQAELIRDYSVAGQVVDQVGWLSDPKLIAQYQNRRAGDDREFRRWLAQLVIDRTQVKVIDGTNLLEISYTGATPAEAKALANAIRSAYVSTTLFLKRQDASRNAEWYTAQAQKAKDALDQAETAEADYEKTNGIVLQGDKTDVDTARLQALAVQAPPVEVSAGAVGVSPAAAQLADVDAQIAQAVRSLGPNHPALQQLRAHRQALAAQVASDRAASGRQGHDSSLGEINRAVQAQASKVIQNSSKIAHLKQLQAEVDLRRDQYTKAGQRAGDFQQQAAEVDTGVAVLGSAVAPQSPAFPKMPLIVIGSIALGGGVGVLLSLLLELCWRKVRSLEDLQGATEAPLLAVLVGSAAAAGAAPRISKTKGRVPRGFDNRSLAGAS